MGDACAADGCECKYEASHNYAHVAPQADCFATAAGEPALDWLGRAEHLDEDLAALVGILNARPGIPQLPLPPQRTERWNHNTRPCTPASSPTAASRRSLAAAPQRSLAGWEWQARPGAFLPCDRTEYFRGQNAHCAAGLQSFFADDARLLSRAAALN